MYFSGRVSHKMHLFHRCADVGRRCFSPDLSNTRCTYFVGVQMLDGDVFLLTYLTQDALVL